MDDLYLHFVQQLARHPFRKLLLALSGGVDSRVLLALLARGRDEFGWDVAAVHVHHGLSPNADQWAQHCQLCCREVGMACQIEYVQLDLASGESIEKMAREARYQALSQHVGSDTLLLLGQHADDQLETFLLALKRGSGPKGLAAMAAYSSFAEGHLLRPLLTVSRQHIEAYAKQHKLTWVTDESNADTRYERNFLRHQVTPVLAERWPSIHQAVQRSAELCAEQEALLQELLAEALKRAISAEGGLVISALVESSDVMRRQLIRAWFAHHRLPMPSRQHTERIWCEVALASEDANPKLKLNSIEVRRFQQCLYLVPPEKDLSGWCSVLVLEQRLPLPQGLGHLQLTSKAGGNIKLPDDPSQLWISFDPQGLEACPVGRSGSRKLKKLFQEYGVPSWLRRQIPILMYQDRVVSVADLFVDRDWNGQDCELVWFKSSNSVPK
ncbi:tRNA lysidine(34) synthetase TilS [Vibrio metoecus]|uniref:tRNA lysidine(34) synthetase TilS n=1 Tax=Vibrio metoecus TaxID=1481663 RepID=UPI000BA9B72B|nr:tRNA lysidine(34) synthetase TilS [Vibrio metoecus]PAR55277.1 tRNA lysidine(34) synthetase TilS [Vibrio metoecus]